MLPSERVDLLQELPFDELFVDLSALAVLLLGSTVHSNNYTSSMPIRNYLS